MRLVDSHGHVDGRDFDGDRAAVLGRARAAGVERLVTIGTGEDLEQIRRAVALAEAEPDVFATVGVHPHDAARILPGWWPELEALARRPRVVGVGETGLDYHYHHSPPDAQKLAFRAHVRLARRVGKPVVCHVRGPHRAPPGGGRSGAEPPGDAHPDTLAILDEERAAEVGGVIHCFTGGPDDARAYAARGFYVSFSGIITFKTAEAIRAAVKEVPLDRILIETDCPFLAPVPLRGKRNEPAFLVHTAEAVARAAGVPLADLAEATVVNSFRLFRLT